MTRTRKTRPTPVSLSSMAVSVLALGWFCQLALASATAAQATERVHHSLIVELDPATHRLQVTDRITVPTGLAADGVDFLLSDIFEVESSDATLEEIPLGDATGFYGINGSSVELGETIRLARYRVAPLPESGTFSLEYAGTIDYGLSDAKEEYTRGFRETAGIVDGVGVYLAGSGYWIPYFNDELIEFDLEAGNPDGWHLISQGNGTSKGEDGRARWDSHGPMDEVYLVGGPMIRYTDTAGAVATEVYLHESDDALAEKYLTTTAQYLEMYRGLIGPYPYSKFALVENFWETGYGMPSFTLLGPQIIRFPFILHSSYPHEILHNWWGNSVFVDYASGNWCEGLTAYMADHLIQEQRGKGEDYRRAALQKYRDFVKEGRDFPLSEFRSRHSAATEAVGYGKTLMGFHMLRQQVGDDVFRSALVRFNRSFKGKRASFGDLQTSFEKASGEELDWFFDPWVNRAGAPSLTVGEHEIRETSNGYVLSGSIEQIQKGDPFEIDVPIAVGTADGTERVVVRSSGRSTPFEIQTSSPPLVLEVDPQFDVFRLLDPRETPPSIGQIFGQPEIVAVLPAGASESETDAYRTLMEGWVSDSHSIEIVADDEIDALPDAKGIWVLGRNNRFAGLFADDAESDVEVSGEEISLGGEAVAAADHSIVAIRRHPASVESAVGWLIVEPAEAFPGMARKLPHYGKYSYLAFQGDEPTNVVKGQWPALSSPLRAALGGDGTSTAAPPVEPREALASLAPVFSQQTLLAHAQYLGSAELEGRGVGTEGLTKASAYIAGQFAGMGLAPGGDGGGFLQRFTVEGPSGPTEVTNIIGYIPGSRQDWKDQSFILSAHYDHLGRGWPDVRKGNENAVHPGADDNASGVAVMLELAKNLTMGTQPLRNLVFIAFTAEESGLLGSKYFIEHPAFPLSGLRGIVNIDTVGRLGDQPVSILGTGTADEWQHIFRGGSFVTGVESRNIPEAAGGSDQMSFIKSGIPGVQIFATAHGDYHRPGDTPDKLDGAGLVKVATLVKEAVVYMGEREEPLTITIAAAEEAPAAKPEAPAAGPSQGRRVRLGTMPDFAFEGPGVLIAAVTPDSPASRAGLQEGDVVVRFGGEPIADLVAYSDVMKTLSPGQTTAITVLRNGAEVEMTVTLEAR